MNKYKKKKKTILFLKASKVQRKEGKKKNVLKVLIKSAGTFNTQKNILGYPPDPLEFDNFSLLNKK